MCEKVIMLSYSSTNDVQINFCSFLKFVIVVFKNDNLSHVNTRKTTTDALLFIIYNTKVVSLVIFMFLRE